MIVSIGEDLQPRLLEATDFRTFRVEVPAGRRASDVARAAAPSIVFESDDVAWVSETWLRGQSADAAWTESLAAMIEKARPHGWIRDTPEPAIRAHVKRVRDITAAGMDATDHKGSR